MAFKSEQEIQNNEKASLERSSCAKLTDERNQVQERLSYIYLQIAKECTREDLLGICTAAFDKFLMGTHIYAAQITQEGGRKMFSVNVSGELFKAYRSRTSQIPPQDLPKYAAGVLEDLDSHRFTYELEHRAAALEKMCEAEKIKTKPNFSKLLNLLLSPHISDLEESPQQQKTSRDLYSISRGHS